ncbi:hypothetical protein GOP47_0013023 [Adiantum capillus-veneris]|uniref:Pentatricopeptide repeat-containing protein n=1 Tax=Adiantum capillus-veneris TaxID=13818 RepID=A0A9D4USB5_ADICA|nr:hypothetical protein GOP47_0013023 [Adiantum capillus-veneris]
MRKHDRGFAAQLKACTKLKDVEKGLKLHAQVSHMGLLKKDVFVCASLVDMYAKWGFLSKARAVFDDLLLKDAALWNSLISGYAEHEHGSEALACVKRMQLESITPSAITFTCSLKACASSRFLEKGKELHTQINEGQLLYKDIIVGNALVDMYAKCGSLSMAKQVLEQLSARDVFTWTALLAGYAEYGHGEEALECLVRMQAEGIKPNVITFVCSAKACASIRNLHKGLELHAQIARIFLLYKELAVGNALVDMYIKCDALAIAREVFDMLRGRDVISWTTLITGYFEHGLDEEALKLLDRMLLEGVCPNGVTIISGLNACRNAGSTYRGLKLHAQMESKNFHERDLVLGTTLVSMYAKCGLLVLAQKVFDNLKARDAMLWTALIEGYTENGQVEAALKLYRRMQFEGISPDVFTYVCSLKACGSIGATDEGQELQVEIERLGLVDKHLLVGNSLVGMYAKCDRLPLAVQVFDKLPTRDVNSWNPLIAGYARAGECVGVLCMFESMLREGVTPDSVSFVIVLNACGHAGLCSRSHTYFEAMSNDFGIAPALQHHNSLVDVYSRAGQIDRARELVEKIPLCPDRISWRTVLGACRSCNDVELAKQAFYNSLTSQ